MQFFLFMAVLPAFSLAGQLLTANPLHHPGKRQSASCPGTETQCGQVCIFAGYTCCPDKQGGCPPTEYCSLGSNGEYGCCPIGEQCTGNGGVSVSTDYSTIYSTDTATSYSTSYYSTEVPVTTSAVATHTSAGGSSGTPTTAAASTMSSGPPIATYTGGAAVGVQNNQHGALAAVVLGIVALL